MGKKTKEKIMVNFKSSSKRYPIWIGSNGKIAIDKNFRLKLEERKLKNIDEKIFIIMNALKDRSFNIRDIKKRIGSYLYNKLNLEKSNAIRQKRKANNFSVRDMIDTSGNSISVRLYMSDYGRIMNRVMADMIGLNIKERLLVKTTRSIIDLISKYMNSGLDSVGFKNFNFPVDIKVNLISNSDIPSINTNIEYRYVDLGSKRFKYSKYNYEINVNKSWYYNVYLKGKHILKNDGKTFIVMKIDDNKSYIDYYVINRSSGYGINIKKLTFKRNR
ncbi:MAG: hypothetical protein QXD03_05075 [Candidatus Anstonellales archaeon]